MEAVTGCRASKSSATNLSSSTHIRQYNNENGMYGNKDKAGLAQFWYSVFDCQCHEHSARIKHRGWWMVCFSTLSGICWSTLVPMQYSIKKLHKLVCYGMSWYTTTQQRDQLSSQIRPNSGIFPHLVIRRLVGMWTKDHRLHFGRHFLRMHAATWLEAHKT